MSQALINEVKRLRAAVANQATELAQLEDRVDALQADLTENYARKRGPKVRENGETQAVI
jgi:phage shock protein A